MNNGSLPGKPTKFSPGDDIPAALRDTPDIKSRSRLKPILLIVGLLGLGAIAFLLGLLLSAPKPKTTLSSTNPTPSSPSTNETDNVLGHLPYKEAPTNELQPINADGQIKLRADAAKAFKDMSAAAGQAGVILVPISGFRSVADQQHVFFDVKNERGQEVTKRAEVSAPPGYSEHHTGYAVDIGDGNTSATNLSPEFDKTAAFQWLEKNAVRYNFEMSFPKNNVQGVSYEPWHWRYVGNQNSLETFYKAKHLTPTPTPSPANSPSPTPTSSTQPSPTR